MTINYQVLEEYVNRIVSENIPDADKVSIVKDDTLLPKATESSIIHISSQSSTLLLLYACFARNSKLFKSLLFYYYWTCRNFLELKINTATYCFLKMLEVIQNKSDKIYGYAQTIQFNVLYLFILGHEAYHSCFSRNESLKQSSINDAISFFTDVMKEGSNHNNMFAEKIIEYTMNEIQCNRNSDEKEEYACDRQSIKYLMNHELSGVDLTEVQYKEIAQQLLDMTMMLQYDNNMQRLREWAFKWNSYKTYLSGHIRFSVFRIVNVANTLQEILQDKCDNISPMFREAIYKGEKILSGLMTFNLLDLSGAIGTDEDICENLDEIAFVKEQLYRTSEYLNSILLGEDLSIYDEGIG